MLNIISEYILLAYQHVEDHKHCTPLKPNLECIFIMHKQGLLSKNRYKRLCSILWQDETELIFVTRWFQLRHLSMVQLSLHFFTKKVFSFTCSMISTSGTTPFHPQDGVSMADINIEVWEIEVFPSDIVSVEPKWIRNVLRR